MRKKSITKEEDETEVTSRNANKKSMFIERCEICHSPTKYYKAFTDDNNKGHIICDNCISIIKSL